MSKKLIFKFTKTIASVSILSVWLFACKSEVSAPQVDCSESNLTLAVQGQVDTECNAANGAVEVAVTGGSGEYSYKIGTRAFQPEALFVALAAGNYTLTVRDENRCEATGMVTIRNKDGVNIVVSSTESGCNDTQGSITIDAGSGTPPYLFKIGQQIFQEGNTFGNLGQGDYTVVTKDATGCEVSQNVSILSGISFATTVSAIIENNCAISGCHNGAQSPDFTVFANIQKNASSIKSQVVSKNMPRNGSLSQEQIDAIACWVDDGAPNN